MLNLVFEWLKLFSEGSLPATTVQSVAAAAYADGWGHEDEAATRLAKAGAEGKHPGNCQRDILRLSQDVGLDEDTPAPYFIQVPSAGGLTRQVGVFLPHEQYQLLVGRYGLDACRLSDEDWNSEEAMGPLLRRWGDHPDVELDCRDLGILGIHADGVSYSSSTRAGSTRSVLVASWNVISAPAAALRGRRCMFFVLSKALCCDCGCEGFHTWDPLWRLFSWSMGCLRTGFGSAKACTISRQDCTILLSCYWWCVLLLLQPGLAPSCREDGSPWDAHDVSARLPGNQLLARAALLQVRGDWEWIIQCFRFRHYSANSFCFCCDATHAGPLTYMDCSEGAAWRTTLLTHERLPEGADITHEERFRVLVSMSFLGISPW